MNLSAASVSIGKRLAHASRLIEKFEKPDRSMVVDVISNTDRAVYRLHHSLGAVKRFTSIDDRPTHFLPLGYSVSCKGIIGDNGFGAISAGQQYVSGV